MHLRHNSLNSKQFPKKSIQIWAYIVVDDHFITMLNKNHALFRRIHVSDKDKNKTTCSETINIQLKVLIICYRKLQSQYLYSSICSDLANETGQLRNAIWFFCNSNSQFRSHFVSISNQSAA